MKDLRIYLRACFDILNTRWASLSIKRQHSYIRYFFMAYCLLTGVVMAKFCLEESTPERRMKIDHIENPILKLKKESLSRKDSLLITLKNIKYGKQQR